MINWPDKHDIFGVHVSATTYEQLVPRLIDAAKGRQSAIADFMPGHGLVTAATETPFRQMINQFDVVAPDGQPVRWALNYFHKTGLDDRVYGPELTWRVCRAAADEGVGLLDLGEYLPAGGTAEAEGLYLPDDAHLTAAGHRVVHAAVWTRLSMWCGA